MYDWSKASEAGEPVKKEAGPKVKAEEKLVITQKEKQDARSLINFRDLLVVSERRGRAGSWSSHKRSRSSDNLKESLA